MRVAMDVHAAMHFTHAFATDGSKDDQGRTAWGAWGGADVMNWGAMEVAGEQMLHMDAQQEADAAGAGMEGGRLPDSWDVIDAELYAVFRVLLRVYLEAKRRGGDEEAQQCRVLVLSDCKSGMEEMERVWRAGEVHHEWKGARRAMLEAICRVRALLGVCVMCYVC